MLSNELATLLAPFKLLNNRNSLAATYRSLMITEAEISGCSSYATLTMVCDLGMPLSDDAIYVDTASFLAVLASLPDEQEVIFDANDGVLTWQCGSAKGRLALAVVKDMPTFGQLPNDIGDEWEPTANFDTALQLGALSCGNDSLASVGMYGIVIDNRDDLQVCASDSVTVSSCSLGTDAGLDTPFSKCIVLSPDAAALLSGVMLTEGGHLHVSEKEIIYYDDVVTCKISQLAALRHDIRAIMANFSSAEAVAPIPTDRIGAFIKRVNALSEDKRKAVVAIGASQGQLTLSFIEGTSSSDEYYLVDALDIPDMPNILIDAGKLARALEHVSEVVLDHMDRNVLVFRSTTPDFRFQYLISGKKGS